MKSHLLKLCATLLLIINITSTENVNSSKTESSSSTFSANLFSQISSAKLNENVVISPVSIQTCLALAFFGAKGKTATELSAGLNFGTSDRDVVSKKFNNLLKSSTSSKFLKMANKIYVSKDLVIKKDFNAVAKDTFQSEAEAINFSETSAALLEINNWVENKTENKIKNLLSSLEADTSMILVNAIHFKNQWKYKFDSDATQKYDFWITPDTSVKVDTMLNEDDYKYAEWSDLDAVAVDLPYENSELSMVIVLPNKRDGLSALENKLQNIDLLSLANNMKVDDVHLFLPKFKIESEFKLIDPLKNMGMVTMFSDEADFGDLIENTNPGKISEVVHKAFIDVNEVGTEAAAATYAKIIPLSLNLNQKQVKVDHPFLYFIKDQDYIYFIGHVVKF